jgi:glutathione S-transferase
MDQLEKQLTDNQWLGGQQPSAADREAFDGLSGAVPDVLAFPHTFAWFALVSKFTPAVRGSWTGAAAGAAKGAKPAAKPAPVKKEEKPAEKKDDDFDPFADEMDDEEKE